MEDVLGHAAADSDANQMRQELADLRTEAAELRIKVRALEVAALARTDAAAFLESVLAAVPAFIIRGDHELKIRYVNRYQPGLTPEQTIGRSIFDFVPPEDQAVIRASVERARQTDQAVSYPSRGTGPHGESSDYETFVVPVHEADGTIGVCLAAFDVTAHKRRAEALLETEEKRRALEERLRQAHKLEAIGSLTAGIAHNFNNMLTVIVPTLELVTKLLPPDRAPLVQEASHAARRATQMVQQLMTYAGQSKLAEQRPHLIHPILEAAVGICRRAFGPEIEIETHYEHGALPAVVSCNPTQLEQVIVNVLMNARDAVREADRKKGRVYVRARLCESRVVIEVGDNGAGMSESVCARAFEPFFTTKGAGHGTGLGLATSFAIVRDHQGELSCESTPGVGTTMTIALPQSEQPVSAPTDPPMQSVPTGRCVLLVDDEVAVRTTLCYVLGDAGVSVLVAESGSAALAMLEQHRDVVDLVLLDRSMPGGAGERFVPRLRAISPRVRIVFLSGQMVEPELAALVDGVVQKPVTGPALLDAIQRALSMTEPRAESRAQAHAAPRT